MEKNKEATSEIAGPKPDKIKAVKFFAINWRFILLVAILFLLIGTGPIVVQAVSETRYMRSDTHLINTYTNYQLQTANTAVYATRSVASGATDPMYIGIKVYKVTSDGTRTQIGSGVGAQASHPCEGATGDYTISANWTPTLTSLSTTDAIQVEVYADLNSPPTTLQETFITPQLGVNQLDASQWTVYYVIREVWSGITETCSYNFRFGDSTYNSQITNFTYSNVITVSGTSNGSGTVAIAVNNSLQSGKTATISGGSWSISGVSQPSANDIITVWIDGAADSGESTGVTKYNSGGTGNVGSMVLNTHVLSIGSDQDTSLTVTNLGQYDNDQDENIMHSANSSLLNVDDDNAYTDEKIDILSSDTLTIGIAETLTTHDVDINGTLASGGAATFNVSGAWNNDSVFTAWAETVNFTSTTSENMDFQGSSDANSDIYRVVFNGSGGAWSLTTALIINDDLAMTAGTISGTNNITVSGGDITGTNGSINMTGGTTTLSGTGSLGPTGSGTYTFSSLTLSGTTTAVGNFTVSSVLTISNTYSFDASNKTITLSGTGTPFVKTGTFTYNTSTIAYTGATTATNITSATYYNLNIGGSSTTTTYTAAGDITVTGVLTIVSSSGTNTFRSFGYSVTLSGSGTPFVINATEVFNCDTSHIKYTGSSATNITSTSYAHLDIGGASTTTTYTAAGDITVTGVLTIVSSSGTNTFNASSRTITLSGNFSATPFVINSSEVFTPSTSTVKYTGNLGANVAATTYNNLELKPASSTGFTLASGTINTNGYLTIGNGTNTGSINANTNDPTLNVDGDFTIAANSTFIASNSGTFSVAGSWSNSGIFTHSSGTVTFDAGSVGKTIADGGSNWNNLIFNGSGGGWSFNDSTIIGGDLTMTNGTLSGTQDVTVNGGDVICGVTCGTITLTGGTFNLNGAGNFGSNGLNPDWTFSSLTFGSGSSDATTTQGGGTVTISTTLTISTNQSLNAGSKTWTLSGTGTPFVINGTLTASTSTVIYSGATTATNIASATYYNLNLGGSGTTTTYTAAGDITVTNVLTIVSSSGTNTFDASSRTITLSGTTGTPFVINSSEVFTYSTSTIKYTGNNGSGNTNVTSTTYYNLYLDNGSETFDAVGDMTITSIFTINAGTFDAKTTTLTLSGTGTPFVKTGTFTHSTSKVTYSGATTATNITAADYYNLDLGGSNTTTTYTAAGDIEVSNVLTIVSSSGTNTFDASNRTITLSGTGTPFVINSSEVFTESTSTIKYTGNGDTNITAATYNNLEFSPTITDNRVYTGAGAINVNSNLNINPDAAAKSLTFNLGGTTSVTGSTTIQRTNTATSILDTVSGSNYTFNTGSLTIKAGGTLNGRASALDSNGDVTIEASGALTSTSGNFNIGGNWSNAGTFTHSSGTLIFDGASQQTLSGTMTGASAFYGLTITNNSGTDPDTDPSVIFSTSATANTSTITTGSVKVRFKDGSTYTFTNINWNGGAVGTRIAFRSASSPTQWNLVVTGTQTVSYTNPKDSNACGGNNINPGTGSLNGGNNDCWNFNLSPTITSVSDSPDPQQGGSDVSFTSVASDPDAGDTIKLYICKVSDCANCGPADTSNCWAVTAVGVATNPSASYGCPSCAAATNNYWAKVCDSSNVCSLPIVAGGSFSYLKETSCLETVAANCFSTFSADGYCCDSNCIGTCQRCNATPGTCTTRTAEDNVECQFGYRCDGINTICQISPGGIISISQPVEKPLIERIQEIPEKIEKEIEEISKKVSDFSKEITQLIKPEVSISLVPPLPPVTVPEVTPLVFQGKWQLLPSKPIREFVLSPLPEELKELAQKFPELERTFEGVGISKITDIEKLRTIKLTLPGLTERVVLPTAKIEPGKFALPQGVPVAKLSPEIKKEIPTDIVFAKTGGELIDFNIALTIGEKGEAQQKITTISGKPLQLVVKPDQAVKSVKGYLVFKSKEPRPTSFRSPLSNLAASLVFANPVFAKTQEKPVRVEEKLVLLEFEYTDQDGDGIYTAEIQAPMAEGEYEIITVMYFEDPELGAKEIRLTTVVDPEGYIYEKEGDRETRIPGAIVSLYWLNPETKQYELWPAKEYQQENPQITDVTGKYSFLVPEGSYYLKIEAPGYPVYDGEPFQVKEGSGVHFNIELKTKYWWLKVIDWKTILLIVVILLLLYNFYRDRIREKLIEKF